MGGKGAKQKSKNNTNVCDEGNDGPRELLSRYKTACSDQGLEPNSALVSALSNDANPNCGKQILLEKADDFRSGHCRSLVMAILGRSHHQLTGVEEKSIIKANACKALKELRIWRTKLGEDGVIILADLLRLGEQNIDINFFELLECGVGPLGAKALGRSLSCGMNKSVLTLSLDYNPILACIGTTALCEGLKSNSSLKKLSLQRCNIGFGGATAISRVLAFHRTILQTLDLTGNLLGGEGLANLSEGLKSNKSLEKLLLADNNISSSDANEEGLRAFAHATESHPALTYVDFSYNAIGNNAKLLVKALGKENNTRISTFKVDASVPDNLFSVLHRTSATKKKTGKNKKKKKKN
mmetsp:Transcript_6620/g.9782  ORF Transcript_6620/g.9782 Transcript_6620/m.9782 type:complete len:354 (-) Transcript_6620:1483-2544(-)